MGVRKKRSPSYFYITGASPTYPYSLTGDAATLDPITHCHLYSYVATLSFSSFIHFFFACRESEHLLTISIAAIISNVFITVTDFIFNLEISFGVHTKSYKNFVLYFLSSGISFINMHSKQLCFELSCGTKKIIALHSYHFEHLKSLNL